MYKETIRNYKSNPKKLTSQSLLEVVIAIGVGTMVILALVILSQAAIKSTVNNNKRLEALRIANSGIEALRYVRSCGYGDFSEIYVNVPGENCFRLNCDPINENCLCGVGEFVNCNIPGITPEQIGYSVMGQNIVYNRLITIEKKEIAGGTTTIYEVASVVTWGPNISEKVEVNTIISDW